MAPQYVQPLCSKPLDMSEMTIGGLLVGLESILLFGLPLADQEEGSQSIC